MDDATTLEEAIRTCWLSILAQRKGVMQWPANDLRDAMLGFLSAEEDLLCGLVTWSKVLRKGLPDANT